jgi:hypothetical protein
VRLHRIKLVSDWQYRELMIEVSKRGWRRNEPDSLPRETSQLLDKVLRTLLAEKVTRAQIARALHLCPQDLEELVFGLVMSGVPARHEWSPTLAAPDPTQLSLPLRIVR